MRRFPKLLRVPPLPAFTVLVDREDGTEWVVSHTDDEGTLRVTLNDEALERGTLPPRTDAVVKDSWELGKGVHVFVRGGRIGYEFVDYEAQDHPIQTRVGVVRESYTFVNPVQFRTPTPEQELGIDDESLI